MTYDSRGTARFHSPKKKSFFQRLCSQWQLALMSVPIFLYVLLFNYAPMWGWINAFKDYGNRKLVARGLTPFNGLDNFKWLFSRPDFFVAIRNTLAMSIINLVFGTVSAVLLAVLLNEVRQKMFKKTVQTVTYLPHVLSMVIVVAMAQNIFASNGPINDLLLGLGIVKQPVFWLGEGKHFWWLVGIINVWKEVGWGTIIYISAMTAIDPALYEAAAIDGAGRFQKILHVTLPGIKSTIVTLLIMQLGKLMNSNFERLDVFGNTQVREFQYQLAIYIYEKGLQASKFSMSTAVGLFQSLVGLILVLLADRFAKLLGEEGLL